MSPSLILGDIWVSECHLVPILGDPWAASRDDAGAGENTLRRLALFVYLDHPTKNDVTSGKNLPRAGKKKLNAAFVFSR